MRDTYYSFSPILLFIDCTLQENPGFSIQVRECLIKYYDLRIRRKERRECKPLLFPAREVFYSSLSIAIGMVVDDAIVVLENVTTHIERGSRPKQAAVFATNEVAISVIASTLTMLAVFLPLTMITGMAGVMFKQLGWMVSIIMIVSTACALSLTPMLCSRMLRQNPKRGKIQSAVFRPIEKFLDALDRGYGTMLDWCARHRWAVVGLAVLASPARKILIDHHLYPEDFCQIIISHPEISSTSELVFRLICRLGYFGEITKEGAECIYTGMMTDTGGFTYNSNDREIYFIISELLTKGIDKDAIYRKVYNTYSESRLRLMGYVLTQMKVYDGYNAAMISLTKNEQGRFSYIRGDSEGFVNIPLSIKNVVLSCFLREDTEKPMIKISLRSVGTFPCNKLAAEFFNGGGHLNASGGEFYGTMEEARKVWEQALEKYKPLLTAKE